MPSTDVTDTRGGGAAADDGGDAAAPQDREPGADTRTPSEPLRSQRRHCCSRSRALHCPHSPQDPEGPKRLHAGGTGPRAELEGRPQAPKALVSCGPPLGMCQGWPRSGLANLKVTVSEKPSSFESQSAGCAPVRERARCGVCVSDACPGSELQRLCPDLLVWGHRTAHSVSLRPATDTQAGGGRRMQNATVTGESIFLFIRSANVH